MPECMFAKGRFYISLLIHSRVRLIASDHADSGTKPLRSCASARYEIAMIARPSAVHCAYSFRDVGLEEMRGWLVVDGCLVFAPLAVGFELARLEPAALSAQYYPQSTNLVHQWSGCQLAFASHRFTCWQGSRNSVADFRETEDACDEQGIGRA